MRPDGCRAAHRRSGRLVEQSHRVLARALEQHRRQGAVAAARRARTRSRHPAGRALRMVVEADRGGYMSNLESSPRETACGGRAAVALEPVREVLTGRPVALGGPRAMTVTRTLPNRGRRMVGAWCFVDHYGPDDISASPGMQVAPHPHTGLQTVSWLVGGEVLHRDSGGSLPLVQPGQLNLMTAGHGITHSEESPADRSPILHGVQLWTALPDRDRGVRPHFEHHPDLPVLTDSGVAVKVVMGE